MTQFCIHYQAMAWNKICKQGIDYQSFGKLNNLPCWDEKIGGCPLAEYPSAEQIAEHEDYIAQAIEHVRKFMAHETDICPHCKRRVTSLRQVLRSVYGSCGCRMWQGTIPKAWE